MITQKLADHPIPDLTEDFSNTVFEDPEGIHLPLESEDGARLNFTQADLKHTIERMKSDVVYFQKTMLRLRQKEFSLGPKQIDLIQRCRDEQFVLGVFNRQGGKSTAFSVYDAHELAFADDDQTIIYAPILGQTEIIFGKIRDFVLNNQLLYSYIDQKGGFKKGYMRMLNGNSVTVMSASDQSHVRGHSPTKIQIDESQDIADFKYYEDILPSGAATGAKIQETGTPKGRNHFYETWRGDEFHKVKQVWHECPFISEAYIAMMKKKLPARSFNQEFLCIWDLDDGAAFDKSILDLIFKDGLEDRPSPEYVHYGGVDIGKSPARTALSILRELDEGILEQVYARTYYYNNYKDIISELQADLEEWNPVLTCIDRTGVGDPVADLMDDALPGIEPVFYAPGIKQDMVDSFQILAEGTPPKIYLIDDDDQRKQFMNWKRKKLSSGRYQYTKSKGDLDDVLNSVLLAVKASQSGSATLEYKTGGASAASSLNY